MTKCDVCRHFLDPCRVTCPSCVNSGLFRLSKGFGVTESPTFFLDGTDDQRLPTFEKGSDTYANRLDSLKKIMEEKRAAQQAFEEQSARSFEFQRIAENIKQQRHHLEMTKRSIEQLKQQLAEKQRVNMEKREELRKRRAVVETCLLESQAISNDLFKRQTINQERFDLLKTYIQKLTTIAQAWINDLSRHIFPIERVLTIEEELALRIQALADAQRSINDLDDENFTSNNDDEQHRIVLSSLPSNGNYRIEQFAALSDAGPTRNHDTESFEWKVFNEFYNFLAALGYACQLTNVLADLFCVDLPHDLHHAKFNVEQFHSETLRSSIDELNANVISLCRSQNVLLKNEESTRTLQNLSKLLAIRYRHPQATLLDYTNYSAARYRDDVSSTPGSSASASPDLVDVLASFCSIDENLIRSVTADNQSPGDHSVPSNSRTSMPPSNEQSNSWISAAMRLFRNGQ